MLSMVVTGNDNLCRNCESDSFCNILCYEWICFCHSETIFVTFKGFRIFFILFNTLLRHCKTDTDFLSKT